MRPLRSNGGLLLLEAIGGYLYNDRYFAKRDGALDTWKKYNKKLPSSCTISIGAITKPQPLLFPLKPNNFAYRCRPTHSYGCPALALCITILHYPVIAKFTSCAV